MKFLLVLLIIAGLAGVANAEDAGKMIIDLDIGDDQKSISGTVTDETKNGVAGATVEITTDIGSGSATTDAKGVFEYKLPVTPKEDRLSVKAKAEKDGFITSYANTSFFINNQDEKEPSSYGYKVATADKLKEDPIAMKILENIEKSKQEEETRQKKLQEIKERQRFIEEQRELANQMLLEDIQGWFGQFDPFKPRNAFSEFVSQMDTTVQSIYWGQFNFTEAKTREGLLAMQQVLDANGTMNDARKAFYESAATTQTEINNLNNALNSIYGKNHTGPVD